MKHVVLLTSVLFLVLGCNSPKLVGPSAEKPLVQEKPIFHEDGNPEEEDIILTSPDIDPDRSQLCKDLSNNKVIIDPVYKHKIIRISTTTLCDAIRICNTQYGGTIVWDGMQLAPEILKCEAIKCEYGWMSSYKGESEQFSAQFCKNGSYIGAPVSGACKAPSLCTPTGVATLTDTNIPPNCSLPTLCIY